jgi:hypothetical protein
VVRLISDEPPFILYGVCEMMITNKRQLLVGIVLVAICLGVPLVKMVTLAVRVSGWQEAGKGFAIVAVWSTCIGLGVELILSSFMRKGQ